MNVCKRMSQNIGENVTKHQRETHPHYVEGCFGCKVGTLQLNSGDARRDVSDRKWVSDIQAYKDARAEGIQPGGTSRQAVEEARKASETLGRAYNAEKMPAASRINEKTAGILNYLETGKQS